MLPLSLLLTSTALPLLAHGAIVALEPSSASQVFRAGENCSFSWDYDVGGTWTAMDVDLMSGNNWEMVNVTRVASGIDGTKGDKSFEFECPEVDPPAPIYFYQFTLNGESPVWTTRFTLAAENGTTVDAPNATQPDGSDVPWGVGHIVNGTSLDGLGNSSNPFSQNSTSKPLDNPLLPTSTSTSESTNAWWSPETTTTNNAWAAPASTTTATDGAQQTGISGFQEGDECDEDSQCPEETPCCSEKGFCGTGRNCLAGCNPLGSFKPGACAPVPACQSGEYGLNYWDKNRVLTNSSHWNGDASNYDWLVDSMGQPDLGAITADGNSGDLSLTLSLTNDNNGTTITSTRSVLFGNVTAKVKSVAGAGILTSFSLISGTKDEIDFEFTTNATDLAQTAWFYRGELDDYSAGEGVNVTDWAADYHDYTISWMPDAITWLVDGIPVRNLSKNDTDAFGDSYRYPRTPSRIQFSLWAAGLESSPPGLVEFAGGLVDWNATSYAEKGFYASYVSGVKVECYDSSLLPDFSLGGNSAMSGAFNASAGTNETSSGDSPTSTVSTIEPSPIGGADEQTDTTTQQLWWTPPVSDSTASGTSTTTATGAWWTPALKKLRRRLLLDKVKRADSGVGSYSYGDLDDNGQVSLSGGDADTVISSDRATGLNMLGIDTESAESAFSIIESALSTPTATVSGSETLSASSASSDSTATGTATDSSASPSATGDEKSAKEKWDELGTAAHVGIYIGAAVAALFLLVLIGWIWRKAASSRSAGQGTPGPDAYGAYAPINDQGEMLPTGQIYSGTGEIQPGQQLYAGGQAPYPASAYAAAAAAPAPSVSRKSSRSSQASTLAGNNLSRTPTSSSTKTYQGGYVPSSQLRKQFGVQPEMKQV
ncbi:hypothetical protein JCM6882_003471 [Rhodosporidiobolus microsporus]